MDFKILFVLLLCLVKYNEGLCRDRCIPYPVPFEVGCNSPCGCGSTCNPASSCSCTSSYTPPSGCTSSYIPTSSCSCASSCSPSCFRDLYEPCNTVDVVYFPEVQFPCGMEWDKPFYYGTCWCT